MAAKKSAAFVLIFIFALHALPSAAAAYPAEHLGNAADREQLDGVSMKGHDVHPAAASVNDSIDTMNMNHIPLLCPLSLCERRSTACFYQLNHCIHVPVGDEEMHKMSCCKAHFKCRKAKEGCGHGATDRCKDQMELNEERQSKAAEKADVTYCENLAGDEWW